MNAAGCRCLGSLFSRYDVDECIRRTFSQFDQIDDELGHLGQMDSMLLNVTLVLIIVIALFVIFTDCRMNKLQRRLDLLEQQRQQLTSSKPTS